MVLEISQGQHQTQQYVILLCSGWKGFAKMDLRRYYHFSDKQIERERKRSNFSEVWRTGVLFFKGLSGFKSWLYSELWWNTQSL